MRKIKEILRLHFEQKLGQRQIARSVQTSQSTVHEYLALFPPDQTPQKPPKQAQPDYLYIRQQLEQHRDLTLELLWEEYRQQHPDGYCYSRFCLLCRPSSVLPCTAIQRTIKQGSLKPCPNRKPELPALKHASPRRPWL